jgi:hypothetical protein
MISLLDLTVKPNEDVILKDVATLHLKLNNWDYSFGVLGSHTDEFLKQFKKTIKSIYDNQSTFRRIDVNNRRFQVETCVIRVVGWSGIKEEFSSDRLRLVLDMNDDLRSKVIEFSETLSNYSIN